MDIFLNQVTQFYSNNATNLHHLPSHSTPCCPQHRDRNVTTTYYGVTSPYVLLFFVMGHETAVEIN